MDIGLYIGIQILIFCLHLMVELGKLALIALRTLMELAFKLRLLPCVLYAAVVAIFYEPWAEAHTPLALGILIALGVVALISWIVTLVLWVKRLRLEEEAAKASVMARSQPLQMDAAYRP